MEEGGGRRLGRRTGAAGEGEPEGERRRAAGIRRGRRGEARRRPRRSGARGQEGAGGDGPERERWGCEERREDAGIEQGGARASSGVRRDGERRREASGGDGHGEEESCG